MKNLVFTFALIMTLVCSAFVLNSFIISDETVVGVDLGDDLSQDDGYVYDMVFDGEGRLLTCNKYEWNEGTDSRGLLVDSYVGKAHVADVVR